MDFHDIAPTGTDPTAAPVATRAGDGAREWIDVCAVDDVPAQGARTIARAGLKDVALFRTAAGTVFALLDRCPHRGGPLSQGIVHGERVTCPLHAWTFELADGRAIEPDEGRAVAFALRVEAGRVLMDAHELRALG